LGNKDVNKLQPVEISFYQEIHHELLNAFYLPDEQKKFTGMPSEVLDEAIRDPKKYPVVILAESRPVGFFVLQFDEEFPILVQNPKAILLRAFSINHKEQGQGFAKKGLEMLPLFVASEFKTVDEIVLAVNVKNVAAQAVYFKTGFIDKGIRRQGSFGHQYVLHKSIA
jgi:RimJ/RimL family protein N-acetyltransferase